MANDEVRVVSPVQAGLQSFAGTSLDLKEALSSFRSPSEGRQKNRERREHDHKTSKSGPAFALNVATLNRGGNLLYRR